MLTHHHLLHVIITPTLAFYSSLVTYHSSLITRHSSLIIHHPSTITLRTSHLLLIGYYLLLTTVLLTTCSVLLLTTRYVQILTYNQLYRNEGAGFFRLVGTAGSITGSSTSSLPGALGSDAIVSRNANTVALAFADFDLDGDLDLFVGK